MLIITNYTLKNDLNLGSGELIKLSPTIKKELHIKELISLCLFFISSPTDCIHYIIVHMYSTCNIRSVLFLPGYDDPIFGNV